MKFRDVRKGEFPAKRNFPVICLADHRIKEQYASVAWGDEIGPSHAPTYWHTRTDALKQKNFPYWIPVAELYDELKKQEAKK